MRELLQIVFLSPSTLLLARCRIDFLPESTLTLISLILTAHIATFRRYLDPIYLGLGHGVPDCNTGDRQSPGEVREVEGA